MYLVKVILKHVKVSNLVHKNASVLEIKKTRENDEIHLQTPQKCLASVTHRKLGVTYLTVNSQFCDQGDTVKGIHFNSDWIHEKEAPHNTRILWHDDQNQMYRK